MSEYAEDTGVSMEAASIPDDQLDDYMASLQNQTDEAEDEGINEEPEGDEEETLTPEADDSNASDEESAESDPEEEEAPAASIEGLERILAPFKANGKMIKVETVDDAMSLMQMGANYSEKMHSLKPHLKTIRMLEQQNMLDEGVLHTLIDARNGNVDAIRKLVADAKIDPTDLLDIDPDQPVEYSPKDHAITDTQYEFQNVVDELKTSEFYTPTMDVVTDWDERSRVKMYEDPRILQGLHAVVANGHFEKIQTHLSTLRTFGKVPAGMTDVDAFGMAAQMLEERGELGTAPQQQERNQPKRDEKVVEQKRAVAPAKGRRTAPKAKGLDLDVASMTDDEFMKAYNAGLFKELPQ